MRLSALCVFICSGIAFAQVPTIGGCPVLPADNIWNTPIDTLPVHANSAAYINSIGSAGYLHPDFNSGTANGGKPIGIPFVTVTGSQPKYPVSFLYDSESDPGPYAVPLNAPIQEGANSTGDRHVISIDTTNCKIYDLYKAYPQASSWKANSGAIYDMRSNALRPLNWTSANAAGLPMFPGLVRYDEVASGEIRHALTFTVMTTRKAFVWPARHYASLRTESQYPAMGQRFRLKANYDISPFPPEVQVILRALKKYGMMIIDNGANWFIHGAPDDRWISNNLMTLRNIKGSAFEAVDVSSLMIDQNSGQAKQLGVSVSVTPNADTVVTQANKQFTAKVNNSTNQAVTWSVNGVARGNSEVGYIDDKGLYSAPSRVPAAPIVKVEAKSVAKATAMGAASVTIKAASTACTYTLSPSTTIWGPPGGGTVNVTVTASASNCQWTAGAGFDWGLSLAGSTNRTGSAILQYTFAPNPGGVRAGYVRIANTSLQMGQQAGGTSADAPCTYTISPSKVTMAAAGGTANVTVTASSSACKWTAGPGFDWGLSLVGGITARTGSAVLQYKFTANPGAARGGYVKMGNTSISFIQLGK